QAGQHSAERLDVHAEFTERSGAVAPNGQSGSPGAELLGVLEDLHLVAVADQPVGDGESSDTCSDNENPHLLRPCSCSWLPPPILSARGLPPGCRSSHRVSGEPEKWSPR